MADSKHLKAAVKALKKFAHEDKAEVVFLYHIDGVPFIHSNASSDETDFLCKFGIDMARTRRKAIDSRK